MHEVLVTPLVPILGEFLAKILLSMAMLGASLLASLVVSLGVAWNVADTLPSMGGGGGPGAKSLLERRFSEAPWFYLGFLVSILAGVLIVGFDLVNVIELNLAIQVVNGVAMPLTVGTLFFLALDPKVLPAEQRLQWKYACVCGVLFMMCSILAVRCMLL